MKSHTGSVDGHVDKNGEDYRFDAQNSHDKTKGWYKSSNLPHWDCGGIFQVITYRLADSLPKSYLEKLKKQLNNSNDQVSQESRKEIEILLDMAYGSCVLKEAQCAAIVEENWMNFHRKRYEVIAGVIMPNHVHILIKVYMQVQLGKIIKSWKSYTSRKIKELLISGSVDGHVDKLGECYRSDDRLSQGVWQRGYWDRYIRDEKHYHQTIDYIKKNYYNGGGIKLIIPDGN
jgi:REP element-mobilizing transposase RayT